MLSGKWFKRKVVPVVVVDGTVLVAKRGATVAAATGVTVLKIGFWKQQCTHIRVLIIKKKIKT